MKVYTNASFFLVATKFQYTNNLIQMYEIICILELTYGHDAGDILLIQAA